MPNLMLGMHIVQYAFDASYLDIGALNALCENILLFDLCPIVSVLSHWELATCLARVLRGR